MLGAREAPNGLWVVVETSAGLAPPPNTNAIGEVLDAGVAEPNKLDVDCAFAALNPEGRLSIFIPGDPPKSAPGAAAAAAPKSVPGFDSTRTCQIHLCGRNKSLVVGMNILVESCLQTAQSTVIKHTTAQVQYIRHKPPVQFAPVVAGCPKTAEEDDPKTGAGEDAPKTPKVGAETGELAGLEAPTAPPKENAPGTVEAGVANTAAPPGGLAGAGEAPDAPNELPNPLAVADTTDPNSVGGGGERAGAEPSLPRKEGAICAGALVLALPPKSGAGETVEAGAAKDRAEALPPNANAAEGLGSVVVKVDDTGGPPPKENAPGTAGGGAEAEADWAPNRIGTAGAAADDGGVPKTGVAAPPLAPNVCRKQHDFPIGDA